ncbi:hypothetical protein D9M68_998820 [compost metagenome]
MIDANGKGLPAIRLDSSDTRWSRARQWVLRSPSKLRIMRTTASSSPFSRRSNFGFSAGTNHENRMRLGMAPGGGFRGRLSVLLAPSARAITAGRPACSVAL